MTEVFDQLRQLRHTSVLVRAAHNRSLDPDSERLWSKVSAQPIRFELEINLPETAKRPTRQTKLAVRYCLVNLRTPYRFDNRDKNSKFMPSMPPKWTAQKAKHLLNGCC